MSSTISKIEINNIKHDIRASKLGNSTVGGTAKPIYLENGVPTECTNIETNVEPSLINGNIKIDGNETVVYEHPDTSGNKHIPSGGTTGQVLKWSSDGDAVWSNNTIYRKRMVTLPTTGWIGDNAPYTIDIQIEDVLENSDVQITPILEMTLEQLEAWENLRLYAGKTYDGYITLKANGFKPNVEIPLEVLIGSVVIEETTEQITE